MLKPPENTGDPSQDVPSPTHPFKGKTGVVRIVHAFFNSLAGLQDAWREESAFRQEILMAVVLVPIACIVPVSPVERPWALSQMFQSRMVAEPVPAGVAEPGAEGLSRCRKKK